MLKNLGIGNRSGFALPAVLLLFTVLSIVSIVFVNAGTVEQRISRTMRESSRSFFAAESGLNSAIGNWDQDAMDTLLVNTGDSFVGAWTTLNNGCDYQVVYRRIDGASQEKFYSLESTGRGPAPLGQESYTSAIIGMFPLGTSLAIGGDMTISGNVTIDGECSDIHTNGDLTVNGNSVVSGDISTTGTMNGGGTVYDTLGNVVTAETGADPLPIPDLNPNDYCGDADYIFNGIWGTEVATSTTRNLSTGTWWGWKYSGGTYITDNDNVAPGTYCMDQDVEIGNQLGTPSTPLPLTILTDKSVAIAGDPYIVSAHPDGILIMADGDIKLNGSPSGGDENFEGLIYAGSQCEISGTPAMHGQLICRNDPNPFGSENWANQNKISGNFTLTYSCGGLEIFPPYLRVVEGTWAGRV